MAISAGKEGLPSVAENQIVVSGFLKKTGKPLGKGINKHDERLFFRISESEVEELPSGSALRTDIDQESTRGQPAIQEHVDVDNSVIEAYVEVLQAQAEEYKREGRRLRTIVEDGALIYFRWDKGEKRVTALSRVAVPKLALPMTRGKLAGPHGPCTDRDKLCAACRVFGMVEERKAAAAGSRRKQASAFAGHVYLSQGRLVGRLRDKGDLEQDPATIEQTLPPLSTPKPSASEFYLESISSPGAYVSWKHASPASARLRGRKFYRHSRPGFIGENVERTSQNATVHLLPDGAVFELSIRFENLSDDELGCLVWCLTPRDNGIEIRHKIGMGRPVGLGSCRVEIVGDAPDDETAVADPWRWTHLIQPFTRYASFTRSGRRFGEAAMQDTERMRAKWRNGPDSSPGDPLGELLEMLRWPPGESELVTYPSLDPASFVGEEGFRWFQANRRGPVRVLPRPSEENRGRRLTAPP